jgi:hypothetical protein
VSFIPKVEQWVAEMDARIALAGESTVLRRELEKVQAMNRALLADLRSKHEPKQGTLAIREPGED